ncbi:MAG: pseudaminic acid cytidylyltransferase [Gammaproteobacteria bacterium]|jgi:pseudaminic acid cytidylyltransferase|nr:pseudaminic acid cytidylyltransferase [Gammaproteobacteria bacterium]MBU2181078.1 pseudaminic acid cytidylyltransferase [Gammaproteobacteria bacterium]MBU2225808.1 pseudaminic acid cytidylyltransferase [Gammaproteobacteria bacterium]MBU2278775.1 pseudaminic acid cytidylyltransferase [Gammaproteobacteria bacterium]
MKLAVIPARGGSKRIPRKNIKLFNGKPMIAWSIEAALQSQIFDQVIVSTDDEEIATIAKQFGAKVPFLRPATLADDYTGTAVVVQHAINWVLQNQWQQEQDPLTIVACIYATAPLLSASVLNHAMAIWQQRPRLDFIFSGCRFSFPIQRALYRDTDGAVFAVQPEAISKRSQDLPETFHDAGQFYLGTAESWLANRPVFSKSSYLYELPQYLVQDIDTIDDWQRAELLHQLLLQRAQPTERN